LIKSPITIDTSYALSFDYTSFLSETALNAAEGPNLSAIILISEISGSIVLSGFSDSSLYYTTPARVRGTSRLPTTIPYQMNNPGPLLVCRLDPRISKYQISGTNDEVLKG
jgi:hypothetical protein